MKCVLLIGFLLAASGAAPEQTVRPLPEWKLNVAKSTFDPGPPPRSTTTTVFAAGRYIRVASTSVDAKGHVSVVEYRVAADGEEVRVKGTRAYDSLTMKSIDANTTEATRRKKGQIVQISTRVTSEDGNTATFTTVGTDERGRKIRDVTVFERQ